MKRWIQSYAYCIWLGIVSAAVAKTTTEFFIGLILMLITICLVEWRALLK